MPAPMQLPEGKIMLTYDDYVAIPNDHNRYEILDGELSVTPAPMPKHQTASLNLGITIGGFVKARGLGRLFAAPIDLILESTAVLQPDLVFISNARLQIITQRAIEGAPDLVIEILSPSTGRNDRGTKAQIYARHEIPFYWIVDPDRESIEIYRLHDGSYLLEATLEGALPMAAAPFDGLLIVARELFV